MGPKRVSKSAKQEDTLSGDEYEPKKEVESLIKLENETGEIPPDRQRYVHGNPTAFKGRLGYA
jgi:hypothetical protein